MTIFRALQTSYRGIRVTNADEWYKRWLVCMGLKTFFYNLLIIEVKNYYTLIALYLHIIVNTIL